MRPAAACAAILLVVAGGPAMVARQATAERWIGTWFAPSTARVHLHKARQRLAAILREEVDDVAG